MQIASSGFDILPFIRILMLIGFFIYILFALVVIRQIQLMTSTIDVGFKFPIQLIGYVNLIIAVGAFLIALSIL